MSSLEGAAALLAVLTTVGGVLPPEEGGWGEEGRQNCPGLSTMRSYEQYDAAIGDSPDGGWMNHGYAPAAGDDVWRFQRELYFVVAGRLPRGARLLEVGCGRGAGLEALARAHNLSMAVGVDLLPAHVDAARLRFPRLHFVRGHASNLPFSPGSFDAVLNIESAHMYPDFARFLRQVARVLVAGGSFLFADTYHRGALPVLQQHFDARPELKGALVDITDRVCEACRLGAGLMAGRSGEVYRRYHRRLRTLEGEYCPANSSSVYVMGRFVRRG